MLEDFTNHQRWGLVIHKHRSVWLEFTVRDKRDALRIRGIIPKFQDLPIGDFLAMIGDANSYSIEFPSEYGTQIDAAAENNGIVCKTEDQESLDYLIYDIAKGDLLELDDEDEYQRIVGMLRANGNPIVETNEY